MMHQNIGIALFHFNDKMLDFYLCESFEVPFKFSNDKIQMPSSNKLGIKQRYKSKHNTFDS